MIIYYTLFLSIIPNHQITNYQFLSGFEKSSIIDPLLPDPVSYYNAQKMGTYSLLE